MVEVDIVQQLHQLDAPEMDIIDALQEEKDHVLHFVSRIGHRRLSPHNRLHMTTIGSLRQSFST
jgi:hypothetical protein